MAKKKAKPNEVKQYNPLTPYARIERYNGKKSINLATKKQVRKLVNHQKKP